jgi:hypothetical protein
MRFEPRAYDLSILTVGPIPLLRVKRTGSVRATGWRTVVCITWRTPNCSRTLAREPRAKARPRSAASGRTGVPSKAPRAGIHRKGLSLADPEALRRSRGGSVLQDLPYPRPWACSGPRRLRSNHSAWPRRSPIRTGASNRPSARPPTSGPFPKRHPVQRALSIARTRPSDKRHASDRLALLSSQLPAPPGRRRGRTGARPPTRHPHLALRGFGRRASPIDRRNGWLAPRNGSSERLLPLHDGRAVSPSVSAH